MVSVNKETISKLLDKPDNNNIKVVKIGEVDGEDVLIEVKKTITMEEYFAVCSALSTPPFATTDDDGAMYVPTGEITSFRVALVRAYIPGLELPEDVLEAYEVCCGLNIFQVLRNHLKYSDMYRDLHAAAERYSDFHRLSNSGLLRILSVLSKSLSQIDLSKILEQVAASGVDVGGMISTVVQGLMPHDGGDTALIS